MGNSLDKYFKDPQIVKLKPQFSKIELYMLALIFRDLSARQHGIIDKETFLQFFPLTGLWGERLFEKFDLKHTGNIDFYEFINGIATCCNSSEDEKIHLLFSLYDMDQDGFIKKKEMITMLYNYPKNHIKFITDEIAPDNGQRLEQVTEAKRQSIQNLDETSHGDVIPHNVLSKDIKDLSMISVVEHEDLIVAEEQMGYSFLQVERDIRQPFSYFVKKEEDERNMRESMTLETERMATQRVTTKKKDTPILLDIPPFGEHKKKNSGNLEHSHQSFDSSRDQGASRKVSVDKMPSKYNHEPILSSGLRASKGRHTSTSTIIMDQSYVIATTVNTRVKEYASFMFKTFDGANSRGKISYEEFKQWISMHPVILKVFDDSFHQDLWSTQHMNKDKMKIGSPVLEDGDRNLDSARSLGPKSPRDNKSSTMLKYREKPVEYSGYLFKKGKKTKSWKKRYFELEEHFLIYYEKKDSKYPKGIMFLEGCYIEEAKDFNSTHKHGFVITHKSESYQAHYLYCNDKSEFDEWMSHLRVFQSSSVMDLYAFQEKIGKGKFSVVFRATTKDAKQNEYAVKVIDKKSLKPEEKEFLISETCVMKILDHPSMIKLIDTIETRTNIYIVTEIVKDGDLFDYILTRDFLEEYTASFIMKKLLLSIDYLHSTGIIHRDLKPENILITLGSNQEVKELKIIDFGFAKLVNEGVMITDSCGTPNYVAPEVLGGGGYDKRADIWSLGTIMYLMIRGLLPFDDTDVNRILTNTMRAELPLYDDHWRNVSPEGRDLVSKFLRKDPNDRIDVREALKHPWIKDREKLRQYQGVNKREEGGDDE